MIGGSARNRGSRIPGALDQHKMHVSAHVIVASDRAAFLRHCIVHGNCYTMQDFQASREQGQSHDGAICHAADICLRLFMKSSLKICWGVHTRCAVNCSYRLSLPNNNADDGYDNGADDCIIFISSLFYLYFNGLQ